MKRLSGLLTGLSVLGVIVTGVLSFKAGRDLKDEEIDLKDLNNVKKIAPKVAAPIVAGVATAACGIGAHRIDVKNVVAASAIGIGSVATLKHYDAELKEFVGPAKYDEFKRKVGKKIEENAPFATSKNSVKMLANPEDKRIKFVLNVGGDPVKFESTWQEVLSAEMAMNKSLQSAGDEFEPDAVTIAAFKDALNIEPTDEDVWNGWDPESVCSFNDSGILWIEWKHVEVKQPDGSSYWMIECPDTPSIYLYDNWRLAGMNLRQLEEAYQNGIISEEDLRNNRKANSKR